ncbi:MAG: UDP-N-acetylglucosamine--N-acetylmuramyl-(pentapeptide) pyrophosphoryl-undecaprenol N-acetylglucosamine transferase, partial [Clostridia bacterium]|nr:UDP-N-acetylglucosamine--N-acetylmuramyl-(pentapeptide) pyrophosphoryl-undecaprenol N-acetylglucosamine transferase [Clostridia bacterium]
LCGCPLLTPPENITKEEAKKQLGISENAIYVLSYGGSMGAEKVNEACLELMRDLGKNRDDILHQHACGAIELEAALAMYKDFGLEGRENLMLSEYIYDMPLRMAAADIVISRAGAMTVSELAMMKKTSIMIPSPNVTNNHQYKNAKVIADMGGTVLLEEKELIGGRLKKEVEGLLADAERRKSMGEAISHFADLDANKLIYEEILRLIGKEVRGKE